MSARRSQTRNGGTMPAACFDVRPSPSPAVPCGDYNNTNTSRKAFSSVPPKTCFDVPNIPGSGAEPRVVLFPSVTSHTRRIGGFRHVGTLVASVVADIALARSKKRTGE